MTDRPAASVDPKVRPDGGDGGTAGVESAVRACYGAWSRTYYDQHYGAEAPYPPVHVDLVRGLLEEAGTRVLLDAGCGPASFLRTLDGTNIERYGFDLTPEMVVEARRVLGTQGVPPERLWSGSVLEAAAFVAPDRRDVFDAAVCVGVMPHIEPAHDELVVRHLRDAVRPGGLVVIEARNALFALFTLNRYSYAFFRDELIRREEIAGDADPEALDAALAALRGQLRMDLPPVRGGRDGSPGYDEVLARGHNPLLLRQQFAAAGFRDVRLLFYHYHCLPPFLAEHAPELFRGGSLAMEDPEDWRGHFMASAFLVAGVRA